MKEHFRKDGFTVRGSSGGQMACDSKESFAVVGSGEKVCRVEFTGIFLFINNNSDFCIRYI